MRPANCWRLFSSLSEPTLYNVIDKPVENISQTPVPTGVTFTGLSIRTL